MEIREFAEQIVFGDTLADKLIRPTEFSDNCTGSALPAPKTPHRPPSLAFDRRGTVKPKFPKIASLDNETHRGEALHFFANHELMALELMALVLLRFPDTPPQFRRGLVGTILQEQDHLQMYCRRMDNCGLQFGDLPISDFFWSALSGMASPMEYVAGVSLTLEQANLDFARYYRRVFSDIGDDATAIILDRVYVDEISHVKYGLQWLQRWKEPGESDWTAYTRSLHGVLTPERAKGIGFNEDGRKAAGLSQSFIDELAIFSHSKGRSPTVHYFNPAGESHMAMLPHNGIRNPAAVENLTADLASLMMFAAVRDDVVIVPKVPSASFLRTIRDIGFHLPEFIEANSSDTLSATPLTKRKLGALQPWCWSPDSVSVLRPLFAQVTRCRPPTDDQLHWIRTCTSKVWGLHVLNAWQQVAPERAMTPKLPLMACDSQGAIDDAITTAHKAGFDGCVLKAPYGSAGRQQHRIRRGGDLTQHARWTSRMLEEQGVIIVEPWLKAVVELSAHFDIDHSGTVRYLGFTRLLTTQNGQYTGTVVGRPVDGLPAEVTRALFAGHTRRLHRYFRDLGTFVSKQLAAGAYTGPVGIDAMLYQHPDDGRYCFRPITEINPRWTMGRIALNASRRVAPGHTALWLLLPSRSVVSSGHTMDSIAATMTTHYPTQFNDRPSRQLTGGVAILTDPGQARNTLAVMSVGRSLAECCQPFECMNVEIPSRIALPR